MKHFLFVVAVFILHFNTVYGQKIPAQFPKVKDATWGAQKITIKLDPFTRIPIGDVPFDRYFVIRAYFNETDSLPNEIWLTPYRTKNTRDSSVLIVPVIYPKDDKSDDAYLKIFKAIDVTIPPLNPNSKFDLLFVSNKIPPNEVADYLAIFKLLYQRDIITAQQVYTRSQAIKKNRFSPQFTDLRQFYRDKNMTSIIAKHDKKLDEADEDMKTMMVASNFIMETDNGIVKKRVMFLYSDGNSPAFSTIHGKIQTTTPFKIIADAGLVVCGFQKGFTELTPYVGINYSFRYLDSDIPFRLLKSRLRLYQRITLNAGLTLTSLAKDKYRDNLFSSYNVLIGAGYKFSHVISLAGGSIIYKNLDPNPLTGKKKVAFAPYFALSFNLKIKDALGDIAKVFAYGK